MYFDAGSYAVFRAAKSSVGKTTPRSFVADNAAISPASNAIEYVRFSFGSFDFHPTDAFDSSLAVEFPVGISHEYEVPNF